MTKVKKYQGTRFCTIDIPLLTLNEESKECTILHKTFRKYYHSKRLTRQEEVRDAILSHYGFKINYLEEKERFKSIKDLEMFEEE